MNSSFVMTGNISNNDIERQLNSSVTEEQLLKGIQEKKDCKFF